MSDTGVLDRTRVTSSTAGAFGVTVAKPSTFTIIEEDVPTLQTRTALADALDGRNMIKADSLDDLMSRLNG